MECFAKGFVYSTSRSHLITVCLLSSCKKEQKMKEITDKRNDIEIKSECYFYRIS